MNAGSRRPPWARLVALAAVVLALGLAPAAFGPGAAPTPVSVAAAQGPTPTPSNATVRHEDPSSIDRSGDLGSVEAWLAGRLTDRLDGGTVSISRGQYETARSLVGDRYDAQLARYVQVAGATPGRGDDAAAQSFRAAGKRTRTFSTAVQRFEAADRAYERSRGEGNASRTRALARRVLDRARSVNRSAAALDGSYDDLGNRTNENFTAARTRVGNVSTSVRTRADAVASATFVETRVSATATPATVSFRSPARVRGRLQAEDGTPLSGRLVHVGRGPGAATVRTNDTGAFAGTTRPVTLSVDAPGIPVAYVPANDSVYLGATTVAPATIEPVTPTVNVSSEPTTATFGEPVAVRGTVSADGTPVPGVPVVATVDGVALGRGTADADGRLDVSGRLPADVPAGTRTVTVRVDQSGRAIASATGTAPLSVDETPTTLSAAANATRVNGSAVLRVTGRLATADGRPVPGRSVALAVDGTTVRSVTTDATGRYAATLDAGSRARDATVVARFASAGTNLEDARATATASLPGSGGSDRSRSDRLLARLDAIRPWWPWLAVAAVLVGLGGGTLVRNRRGDTTAAATRGDERSPATAFGPGADGVAVDWRTVVEPLLSAGEPDRAVRRAYGEARRRLARELDVEGALTHWEFLAACRERGLSVTRGEALRALTEAFEGARFAPTGVSPETARAAIERVPVAVGE